MFADEYEQAEVINQQVMELLVEVKFDDLLVYADTLAKKRIIGIYDHLSRGMRYVELLLVVLHYTVKNVGLRMKWSKYLRIFRLK